MNNIMRNTSRKTNQSCSICGSNMQFLFKANNCCLDRCLDCGFTSVRKNQKERFNYNESYFTNDKYRDEDTLNKEFKRRISILNGHQAKGDSILEIGCAQGDFVSYASKDYNIYGCDISDEAIKIACRKYPKIAGRFTACDIADNDALIGSRIYGKYDAICMWDTIEHVENPLELIRLSLELLNSKGTIYLSTPYIDALFSKITKSKWPFMTPPEHLSFLTKKSLTVIAKKYNLEILEWSSKGKWANLGFIIYKFNRVSHVKIPQGIQKLFEKKPMNHWSIYVPTKDIQYIVLRKKR